MKVRSAFLHNNHELSAQVYFGKTGDSSMGEDPLQLRDPWKQASGPNRSQSKWEDLRLPADHPFCNAQGERMEQVTRQQLLNGISGIAFATRPHLGDLLSKHHREAAAVLLPLSDRAFFEKFVPSPAVSGPHEVTVRDIAVDGLYKRQVMLVLLGGKVDVKMPETSFQVTSAEMKELVFELDSRLVSRDVLSSMKSAPHDTLKAKVLEQFASSPLQKAAMYGYRKVDKSGDQCVFQIIAKVPASSRPSILVWNSAVVVKSWSEISLPRMSRFQMTQSSPSFGNGASPACKRRGEPQETPRASVELLGQRGPRHQSLDQRYQFYAQCNLGR